jgi:hypothetical protein
LITKIYIIFHFYDQCFVHFCLDPAWSAQKRTAAADRQKNQVAQTGWSPPAVATAGKIQSGASQASAHLGQRTLAEFSGGASRANALETNEIKGFFLKFKQALRTSSICTTTQSKLKKKLSPQFGNKSQF